MCGCDFCLSRSNEALTSPATQTDFCKTTSTAKIIHKCKSWQTAHNKSMTIFLVQSNISASYNSKLIHKLNQIHTKIEQWISKTTLTYYQRVKQANLLWSGPTWVYLYSPWIFSFWKYWFRRALAFSKVQFPWSPAFKSTSSDSRVCWSNEN